MATSRSPESTPPGTARACLFSGRPDPTWTLDRDRVEQLLRIWAELESTTRDLPPAPPLGYRGIIVNVPGRGRFHVYGGVALRRPDDAGGEMRLDIDRRLERAALATAPSDTLPPDVLA
jgi:hypothetical protein